MSIETAATRKSEGYHSLPVEYPVLTLAAIGALNAAVVAADAAAQEGYNRRSEVETKRLALVARLGAIPEGEIEGSDDLEEGMADALAADPAGALGGEDFAAATERRVETRRAIEARAAERDIIGKAISKVDGEIATIDDEIAAAQAQRVDHWKAFLEAAHPFLIDRFRRGFKKLVDETLQAAVDLQNVKLEKQPVLTDKAWQVVRDSSVKLSRYVPYERWLDGVAEPISGTSRVEDRLFEYDFIPEITTTSEAIDRFRASLPR